jgi:DNA-binding transcriptional ArsR family regulator/rhodanese-related sulfurtransferase
MISEMMMTKNSVTAVRPLKVEMFEQFARVAKALASSVRLEVLDLLAQKEYSVESLAQTLDQSLQNMSRHLQVLRQARLVTTRKDGNFVHYRLTGEDVSDLVQRLQAVSHRHLREIDEVLERFQSHTSEFEPVDIAELVERARAGHVVVLDVRPAPEFASAHLPHARNIPLSQLESRVSELPKRTPIVAYCRGRYCLLAYAAVDFLASKGLRAERIDEGIIEWKLRDVSLDKD